MTFLERLVAPIQDVVLDLPYITTAPGDMVTGYLPIALLITLGLLTTLMAKTFMDNPKQVAYKLCVFLGAILAPVLALHCVLQYTLGDYANVQIAFLGIAAFTLALRPLLKWNIAFALALLVAMIIYYGAYLFIPAILEFTGISGLLLVTVAVSVLAYHLFSLAETGLEFVAGVLNAWPIMMIIGLVALGEGVAQLMGLSLLGML